MPLDERSVWEDTRSWGGRCGPMQISPAVLPSPRRLERAVKRVERCARPRRGASRRPLFATLTATTVVMRRDAPAELHLAHSRAARTRRSVSTTNIRGHRSIRSINRVAPQCGGARWDFKPNPAVRGSSGNVFISVASALGCGHRRVCACSEVRRAIRHCHAGRWTDVCVRVTAGTKRAPHGARTPALARGSSTKEQAL
jgi:hypothetical protein